MAARREPSDERILAHAVQNILHTIQEGVHIVDAEGRSILYNRAMEQIEGLSAEEVLGKHLLDVLPGWTASDSTLLTALETGRTIDLRRQSYLNLRKKRISTVNTTFPILSRGKIIGAVEIARNYTEVNALSEQIIDLRQRLNEKPRPARAKRSTYTFDMLIGRAPAYLAAIDIARRAAALRSSVLIVGETGTGKELFAQGIHSEGPRRDQPFIGVNCAAMPDSLLEGILFGTTRGSYTGAEDRPGLFEQAHGGTLFLDEINSMSLHLQSKILRALQEGSIRRLGALADLSVDVRIIAASNEPLEPLMRAGAFRRDLYYRLDVIDIRIPPLRERIEDIPLLAEHFLGEFNRSMGKDVWMLSQELRDAFLEYPWIGNVRELQNLLESAMAMVGGEHVLGREHLPARFDILPPPRAQAGGGRRSGARGSGTSPGSPIRTRGFSGDLNAYLEEIERRLIFEALDASAANISRAAASLGISRQNLQYKMKRHGIS